MGYSSKTFVCPFFKWDERLRVHCECGCLSFHDRPEAEDYIDRHCAALDGWKGCSLACSLLRYYERTEYSGNTSNFMDILYNTSINDREAYEIIYADMVASGIQEDKIRNAMEARMKRDQGVESVADLEARYLTPKQEQSYNSLRQRVTGTSVWSAASAEQREALEEDLYNLTVANSSGLKLQEKIDGGAAYGIDEADYLLYRLALHVVDQPTESGNLGSYTGDEVEAAIDMLTGLDDEARAYLWEAAGKSEKSNPYK